MADLELHLRHQNLTQDDNGNSQWQVLETSRTVSVDQTALLLCDVWNTHWSRGAAERVDAMVPRMNEVVASVREKGVQIIHAPSSTLDFYADTPARQRMIDAPQVDPPEEIDHDDPPMPVDATDGGSDTGENPKEMETTSVWTRQHAGIDIDQDRDGISDQGSEVYNFMQQKILNTLLLLGVHTNMCVLNRTFAIKQMKRWGVDVALVRDLTDAMYNPAKPPYVSHAEGTRLIIEYIEKFWCPTILSDDLT